jgi:hypothetical protein
MWLNLRRFTMQLFNPLTGRSLFSRTEKIEDCPLCKKQNCNCKELTLNFTESWVVRWGVEGEIGGHKVVVPALVFTNPCSPGLEIVISQTGITSSTKIPEIVQEIVESKPAAVKAGSALRLFGLGTKAQVTGFVNGLKGK